MLQEWGAKVANKDLEGEKSSYADPFFCHGTCHLERKTKPNKPKTLCLNYSLPHGNMCLLHLRMNIKTG